MTPIFFPRDEYFMRLALRQAERSLEHDDVPVGCVVARESEVIAAAPNERELRGDPTAHCEILAIREAAKVVGSWRLSDVVLYVTLEPCAMCAGAMVLGRVPRVVYGAEDPQGGSGRERARRAGRTAAQPSSRGGGWPPGGGVCRPAAGVLLAAPVARIKATDGSALFAVASPIRNTASPRLGRIGFTPWATVRCGS